MKSEQVKSNLVEKRNQLIQKFSSLKLPNFLPDVSISPTDAWTDSLFDVNDGVFLGMVDFCKSRANLRERYQPPQPPPQRLPERAPIPVQAPPTARTEQ